jgi:hypothetical protein
MSRCDRQSLDAAQLAPLLTYLTDLLTQLLPLYLRTFTSPGVTISGLEQLIFSPPVLSELGELTPCLEGCTCRTSTFRVRNLTLTVTAPQATMVVKGLILRQALTVRLRKVSVDVESDCHSYLRVNELQMGALDIVAPDQNNEVGRALRRIPRLLWEVRNGLRRYVKGRRFVLPVRVGDSGTVPLLCA